MNYASIALLLAAAVVLTACGGSPADSAGTDGRPGYCDHDNLICPDGSIVMRTGSGCEFVCPEAKESDFCDYGAPDKTYASRFADMCDRLPTDCPAGEQYFRDECGCGCTLSKKADRNGGIDPNS